VHRRNAANIDTPTLATTVNNTSDTASMTTTFGALNAQQYMTGNISELVFYPTAQTGTTLDAIEANINSYYAIY
jgi:hypothetical protein